MVPPDNRFSATDRAAAIKRLCEALAMESGNDIPVHHRAAHTRSAAHAIGCRLDDLRISEQNELAGLCDQFAATDRGELRVAVLSDEPGTAGTVVGVSAAALYRHPAGGRFAPDL